MGLAQKISPQGLGTTVFFIFPFGLLPWPYGNGSDPLPYPGENGFNTFNMLHAKRNQSQRETKGGHGEEFSFETPAFQTTNACSPIYNE